MRAQPVRADRGEAIGHRDPRDDKGQGERLTVEDQLDQADAPRAHKLAEGKHDGHEQHRQQTQADACQRMFVTRRWWRRKLLWRANGGRGLHAGRFNRRTG